MTRLFLRCRAALVLVNGLVGTVGRFVALLITNTKFSMSSGLGVPGAVRGIMQTGVGWT
jgi:hypothetical protein